VPTRGTPLGLMRRTVFPFVLVQNLRMKKKKNFEILGR
jgi:hypothetical protein